MGLRLNGPGTAALNKAIVARARPIRTLAMLGDSITAGVVGTSTPQVNRLFYDSPLLHTVLASQGSLSFVDQFGVPGETTAQILARVGQVVAAAPDACMVLGGTNDGGSTVVPTNLAKIYDALLAGGVRPIACTIPPSSAVDGTNYGIRSTNTRIKHLARTYGLALVDFHAALVDPATGNHRSGWNSDITHPNARGYRAMGEMAAAQLATIIRPGTVSLPYDPFDVDNTSVPFHSFVPNGLLQGGVTSGRPTGYDAGSTTGTVQVITTDPLFAGNVWQVEATDNATHHITANITATAGSNFSPGELVEVVFKLSTSGLDASGATVGVGISAGGSTGATNICSFRVGTDVTAGVFHWQGTVPPGTTSTQVQVRSDGGSGNYTYKIGQFAARSLSLLGATA